MGSIATGKLDTLTSSKIDKLEFDVPNPTSQQTQLSNVRCNQVEITSGGDIHGRCSSDKEPSPVSIATNYSERPRSQSSANPATFDQSLAQEPLPVLDADFVLRQCEDVNEDQSRTHEPLQVLDADSVLRQCEDVRDLLEKSKTSQGSQAQVIPPTCNDNQMELSSVGQPSTLYPTSPVRNQMATTGGPLTHCTIRDGRVRTINTSDNVFIRNARRASSLSSCIMRQKKNRYSTETSALIKTVYHANAKFYASHLPIYLKNGIKWNPVPTIDYFYKPSPSEIAALMDMKSRDSSICPYCRPTTQLSNLDDAVEHVAYHEAKTPYACNYKRCCTYETFSFAGLLNHIIKNHLDTTTEGAIVASKRAHQTPVSRRSVQARQDDNHSQERPQFNQHQNQFATVCPTTSVSATSTSNTLDKTSQQNGHLPHTSDSSRSPTPAQGLPTVRLPDNQSSVMSTHGNQSSLMDHHGNKPHVMGHHDNQFTDRVVESPLLTSLLKSTASTEPGK